MSSARPWRDKPNTLAKPAPSSRHRVDSAGPLVPTNVVGAATQRLLATALFFLLQGVKIAGIKSPPRFVWYTILDLLFVYLLPVFAIPRLNFKPRVVAAQGIALVAINYSTFISSAWILSSLFAVFKLVAWLPGLNRIGAPKPQHGLITGKYVVDILPEASAHLDTIAPLCIGDQSSPVYLRLNFNATWPSSVKLGKAELGSGDEYSPREFSKRQISKLPFDATEQNIYLPVSEPGAYYLDGITDDKTGLRVRIQRDRIVVPPCPSASVVSLAPSLICEGTSFTSEVRAAGVAPLHVLVDGEWITLGDSQEWDAVSYLDHEITTNPNVSDGSVSVSVSKIKDGLGNEVDVDSSAAVTVVKTPHAAVVLNQRLPLVNDEVKAKIDIQGNQDETFSIIVDGPTGEKEYNVGSAGRREIAVTKSGHYALRSVHGKLCSGTADGTFEVFVPPVVTMEAKFEVVEDTCAGPSGVNAEVTLNGTAPFKIGYRTIKGSRVISQKVAVLNDAKGKVQFRPKDVGAYTYEFTSVEDEYRHVSLTGPEFRASQQITELPGAQFKPLATTKLCGSSKTSVDVMIRGKGPFSLKYNIDDQAEEVVTTSRAADSDQIRLDLDLKTGTHFVRLISMTDRNGCVTDLHRARTPDIIVRESLPTIGFAVPGETRSAEPFNLSLPLTSSHLDYPARLDYQLVRNGKVVWTKSTTLRNAKETLHVAEPGTYKLVHLDDGVCGGNVDDSTVIVSLYERPKLEYLGDHDIATCHGSSKSAVPREAKILLIGEAPFTIAHELVDPKGQSHVTTFQTRKELMSLELESSLVGQYDHFLWIMDSRYPEFNRSNINLKFSHRVWPPAEASFASRIKASACQGGMVSESLPVALKGQAPFQLTVQVGSEVRTINVTNSFGLDLSQEIGAISGKGSQKIKLLDVIDAHGCRGTCPKHLSETHINVLSRPIPLAPKKLDYCVGDKVSFPWRGDGQSFNVRYAWQGHPRKARSHSTLFEKYVSSPGNLTLLEVSDENGCASPANITAVVHRLPTSTITEESHFSIYAGEAISLGFAFEGTPPFTFEYTRKVNGIIEERNVVKNIMEHTYSIEVGDGGEYEIIALSDKYCHSER